MSDTYHSHQQYLADTKNPYGYWPDHGTGVSCPIGAVKGSSAAQSIPADSITAEG